MSSKTSATHTDDLGLVKYYLDKFERDDIQRYTSDVASGNVASVIVTLLSLFSLLKASSAYFRLKIIEDSEANRYKVVSCPRMLYAFFTKHVFKTHKEFETRYPCTAQMISLVSGLPSEGCSTKSLNKSE